MNIPGYEITRIIARGGASTVFVAVQRSLGREVALKILQKANDVAHATRFMEEGRLLASLHHRNVITVYDVGVTEHWYYIAMEYLQGGSLENRIHEGMTLKATLDLMETLVECLDSLHKRGIIHRDVKPANILFQEDGTPKLTDFGIAKQLSDNQDITMDGTALGSPYYLSPEQASGKPLDGRSDIYSLGIVFYEMLTGEKPFRGESHLETLMAHATEPVPQLPQEYASFQEMLERMIAKNPAERFASASELLGYIRAVRCFGRAPEQATAEPAAAPGTEQAAPTRQTIRISSWLKTATTTPVALVLAGVVATAALLLSGDPEEPEQVAQTATDSPPQVSRLAALGTEPAASATAMAENPVPAEQTVTASGSGVETERAIAATDAAPAPSAERPTTEVRTEPQTAEPSIPAADEGQALTTDMHETETNHNTFSGVAEEPIPVSDLSTASFPSPENQTVAASPEQIAEWLEQGQSALSDYRLTTPPGNNANDLFRQVLTADPGNKDATQGLQQVADAYLRLARGKTADKDYATARVYVDRGLRVSPRHEGLLALSSELSQGKTAKQESSGDAVSRFFGNIRGFFADVPRTSTPQTVVEH